jgi:hypothetical protein
MNDANNHANRSRINRRAFLRAGTSIAVGLPFLEGLQERSAWAQSAQPVFSFFIVTANGVVQKQGSDPEKFWPTATGTLTKENLQAAASDRCTGLLADHASRLLMVRGVNYPAGLSGCGHAQGLVQCLTGAKPNGGSNTATSTGPSVDTIIAQQVNAKGVDPLTLYSGMKEGFINEKLSFSAAGQVRSAEGNPYNVYKKLMGLSTGSTGTPAVVDQLILRRNSVNDLIRAELTDLKGKSVLSTADRDRLDQHFQAIRDMENTMTTMGMQCSASGLDVTAINAMNSGSAFRTNGKIEDVAKLQMDLVAFAFSCNATRVATLQVGDGTDHTNYTIDGTKYEKFHYISHRIQGDGTSGATIQGAVDQHAKIDRFRMGTFKYLLDKWATWSTANGPLLDHAFAMWTSHVANGPTHSFNNLPIIIAGNAGGYLKQGVYVDAGGTTNNKLYNTLITAAGGRSNGGAYTGFAGASDGIASIHT